MQRVAYELAVKLLGHSIKMKNVTIIFCFAALLSVPGNFIFTNTSGVDSLQLLGSAAIEEEPILMLNNDDTQSAAIQLQPVQLLRDSSNVCEQASFSASFSFQIDYASDGFSFLVMGLDSSYLDLGKGYMGWSTDNFVKGGMIAIEYDTKYNSEYNDPSGSHLGINLNFNPSSVATFNTQQTGLNLSDNSVKYSWIDYDAASKKLNVFLDTTNVKPSLPLLAYNVSLCSALRPPTCAGCFSTTAAYFGFTLSSSEEFQRINILTWQFSTQWPTSQIGTNPPSGQFDFFEDKMRRKVLETLPNSMLVFVDMLSQGNAPFCLE